MTTVTHTPDPRLCSPSVEGWVPLGSFPRTGLPESYNVNAATDGLPVELYGNPGNDAVTFYFGNRGFHYHTALDYVAVTLPQHIEARVRLAALKAALKAAA